MAERNLFGTSGIRGDAKTLFTDQFCFDVGRAFVQFLKESGVSGPVAIGRDPRESSPRISKSVSSGMIAEGFDVWDQGIVPIPAINYILKAKSALSGSLMISGSHIKADLNGVKFFAFGEEILKAHEAKIEAIYMKIKGEKEYAENSPGIVDKPEARDLYISYLLNHTKPPYPKWRVVVDPGNGSQSGVISSLLNKCDLDITPLNDSSESGFMARDTEIEADFEQLKNKVVEERADFGVGYDSDGDRAVFVDEKGSYIPGDYTGTLIAREQLGQTIVTPINTSSVVDNIGKVVKRTKVGSPFVVEKMKEVGAGFGFEANGGGIFSEMHSRDGGRTTVEILNILAVQKVPLSELVSQLPKFFIERDKVGYSWELKEKIIEEAKRKFVGIKSEELDGLKIWLNEKSWILFRSSQNAPEFRVFAESDDSSVAKKLLSDGIALVNEVISQNGKN